MEIRLNDREPTTIEEDQRLWMNDGREGNGGGEETAVGHILEYREMGERVWVYECD